ncbi:MAG TPA: GGDEF and EAL domain-containing protein [Bryobacteraceae bacterium]|nr:GGDEF and EAL domain-containing protein [Bryobacteraceae bacterium]
MKADETYSLKMSEADLLVYTLNASTPAQLAGTEVASLDSEQYERVRLRRLGELNLLDTPEGEGYDRITRMAARMFETPIAAVSLTDRDRQWFKSSVGTNGRQIPRLRAPCAAVTSLARPVVIADMSEHAAFGECVLVEAGLKFYAGAPLTTRDGHVLGAFCVLDSESREFSEEKVELLKDFAAMIMAQIELEHDFGRTDPLSGLPNRNQLLEDLDGLARTRPQQDNVLIAIEIADQTHMSEVVGVLGAGCVEDLVKGCSYLVTDALGTRTGVYHTASTTLAVLLQGQKADECQGTLAVLRDALSRPVACSGIPVTLEPAIGVSPFRPDAIPVRDVLRTALIAAHDARSAEVECRYYSEQTDETNRRRLTVLTGLRTALKTDDELHLAWQPRVDLETNVCAGAEALLRWNSPGLGSVSPGEFIPLAEETALIEPLTQWVVSRAVRQIAAWRQTGFHAHASVNVSARNLCQPAFAQFVHEVLQRENLPTSAIELEFTESALIRNPGLVVEQLVQLRALGIRLAIDDFGTGYSSFSYLQRIPADVVKIDQSFIRKLHLSDKDQRLVRSMIAMARDLGFRTVAEGVETAESMELLRSYGCHEVQGYFISKPKTPVDFRYWCEERPDRAVARQLRLLNG